MICARDIVAADFPRLLTLNESCVPHVNSIGMTEMAAFQREATVMRLWEEAGELAGFVIALTAGAAYKSLNYQWFSEHMDSFLYIDRIMVHENFRRRGVATLIYTELAQMARQQGLTCLTCEVNLQPPNPDSMALHTGLGFRETATQKTEGGTKEVSLLVKMLGA
ncbi:MAG: GNAT family N-acetyltransferase [Pseudomonadales bacterium]|nr:GNAT family N-acetyltransferase [Pseudomonadales bacterium]